MKKKMNKARLGKPLLCVYIISIGYTVLSHLLRERVPFHTAASPRPAPGNKDIDGDGGGMTSSIVRVVIKSPWTVGVRP